jgi:hypothetical protein
MKSSKTDTVQGGIYLKLITSIIWFTHIKYNRHENY